MLQLFLDLQEQSEFLPLMQHRNLTVALDVPFYHSFYAYQLVVNGMPFLFGAMNYNIEFFQYYFVKFLLFHTR